MHPKMIFFDMEGTLLRTDRTYDNTKVAPSAWTVLAGRIGPDCLREEEESKDRWIRGEYANYMDWMKDTARIHQKYALTRDLFVEVMDSVEITPGADEAFEIFRSWGAITVVITGGFAYLANRLQPCLKIDHCFSACEYFFGPDGLLEHFNLLPCDVDGKVDFMRLMTREYGVASEECAFVGDGKNDVPLARHVGFSVAFNAQDELKAVASAIVGQPLNEDHFGAVVERIEGWK